MHAQLELYARLILEGSSHLQRSDSARAKGLDLVYDDEIKDAADCNNESDDDIQD